MALSEEEQRLLDQLEAALAAEDPKLANTLRGTSPRRLHRRRAALAGMGFLAGIACLIVGMEVHPVLSVAGFIIMLVSTLVAVTSWRYVDDELGHSQSARPSAERAFMDRMEERWRRRHDEGN